MAWESYNNIAIAPASPHLTVSSLIGHVVLTPPENANRILLQVFTQNIRLVFTEATSPFVPTASVGFQFAAGSRFDLAIADNFVIKIIEEAASASIQYQWVQ